MRFGFPVFVYLCALNCALFAEPRLFIYENKAPISVCNGSLRKIFDRTVAAQPPGYIDPFKIPLDKYRTEVPSALFGKAGHAHIEIMPLVEVSQTYLLLASERQILNLVGSRASAIIEHSMYQTDLEFLNHDRLYRVGGHDMRSEDLRAMGDLFMREKINSPLGSELTEKEKIQLNIERGFWRNWLLPKLDTQSEDFVLITASAAPGKLDMVESILGHELLHAVFFTNPAFREFVFRFVQEKILPEDFEFFRDKLIEPYPEIKRDYFLAVNEMMAYLLQPGAIESLKASSHISFQELVPFAEKYREPLRAALKAAGLPYEILPKI